MWICCKRQTCSFSFPFTYTCIKTMANRSCRSNPKHQVSSRWQAWEPHRPRESCFHWLKQTVLFHCEPDPSCWQFLSHSRGWSKVPDSVLHSNVFHFPYSMFFILALFGSPAIGMIHTEQQKEMLFFSHGLLLVGYVCFWFCVYMCI